MKLLYLSALAFLLISTSALSLTKISPQTYSLSGVDELIRGKSGREFSPIPILNSSTPSFPIVSAEAALAVDLNSGMRLYEKNPDSTLLPASTTKIVTALVAMDYYPDGLVLKVGDVKVDGQKMGLVPGEEITVNSLLYGLLVFSGNDAAEVLAQNYVGGRDAFITAMNLKAKELNLDNSYFTNPTGLDGNGLRTSARDLVNVSVVAMQNQRFAKIVGTKEKVVTSLDGKIVHRLENINQLLGKIAGVMGVKTGWTEDARENLVTYVERNDHRVMIAILGSQDRFGETKELIDWIFANYNWKEVKPPYSP